MSNQNDYSDLDPNFLVHPQSGDLTLLKGKRAVFQSFKTLVLSSIGDFLMDFTVEGGQINGQLFDNMNPLKTLQLKNVIIALAKTEEPRILVKDVTMSTPDNYSLVIRIFYLYENEESISVDPIVVKMNS